MKKLLNRILAVAFAVTFLMTTADAAPKEKTKRYPLKTCIVTDNDLDSMGGERKLVHQRQEVKFCCAPCVKKFQKNPDKYLKKI